MSGRREFPRAIKVAVIKRSTRNGAVYCEGCGALARKWQIDHVRPDGLLGEPTLENAQLLGPCCYEPKNAADTTNIAKAKRREAYALGVRTAPVQSIPSAPMPISERTAAKLARGPKQMPERRPMFEDRK